MKPETVLKKVIERAVKNGWKDKRFFDYEDFEYEFDQIGGIPFVWAFEKPVEKGDESHHSIEWEVIIFDHDFAKFYYGKSWKKKLKEQAVAKDRLAFLGKHLDK